MFGEEKGPDWIKQFFFDLKSKIWSEFDRFSTSLSWKAVDWPRNLTLFILVILLMIMISYKGSENAWRKKFIKVIFFMIMIPYRVWKRLKKKFRSRRYYAFFVSNYPLNMRIENKCFQSHWPICLQGQYLLIGIPGCLSN